MNTAYAESGNRSAQQVASLESDRAPQVRNEIEILDKELAAQDDTITRLFNRLEPVLSLQPPDGPSINKILEPTAPMAAKIYNQSRAVARNTAQLESLLRRLEV